MIKSLLRLLLIIIVLVAIYFAAGLVVTGVWLNLIAAALVIVGIFAAVNLFHIDTP